MTVRTFQFFTFFCILISSDLLCSVLPVDKSTLNYTQVYFEEELRPEATRYELVYYDSLSLRSGKNKKLISGKLPAFWISDLNWGSIYVWHVNSYDKQGKLLSTGVSHHFRIMTVFSNNREETRLLIRTNKIAKHAKGLIFIDYAKTAFNRLGKPVWTVPEIEPAWNEKAQIRDLKITPDNTYGFLASNVPVEMTYDGNIIWRAPHPFLFNNDTIIYHHEFRKTNRGTYMVLGLKSVYRKITGAFGSEQLKKENAILKRVGEDVYKKAMMSVLLEFDKEGRVVWYWDSNEYLTDEDMNFKKGLNGMPLFGTHANAFSENAEGTKVYIGFRDLSRIIKVDKQTKQVDLSYGERFPSGEGLYACHAFRKQHDAGVTNHNSILVLNNDEKHVKRSSVIELKDNVSKKDSVVLWKFNLDFDGPLNGKSVSGGNVMELPNSNILVCGGVLNRVFEVSRAKEVVWDAFVQSKEKQDTVWSPAAQYRASWVPEIVQYHFIAAPVSSVLKTAGTLTVNLTIHNTGNADDVYTVQAISEDGATILKTSTVSIKKNASVNHQLNITLSDLPEKKLNFVIQSTHSKLKRNLSFELN